MEFKLGEEGSENIKKDEEVAGSMDLGPWSVWNPQNTPPLEKRLSDERPGCEKNHLCISHQQTPKGKKSFQFLNSKWILIIIQRLCIPLSFIRPRQLTGIPSASPMHFYLFILLIYLITNKFPTILLGKVQVLINTC